jgi:hypothetical protein
LTAGCVGIKNTVLDDVLFIVDFIKFKGDMRLYSKSINVSKTCKTAYISYELKPLFDLLKPFGDNHATQQLLKVNIEHYLHTWFGINKKRLPEKAVKIPDCFLNHFPAGFAFESERIFVVEGKRAMARAIRISYYRSPRTIYSTPVQ